jgi:hypothetical protein
LGSSQARRARSNDGYPLVGPLEWTLRSNPALVPRTLDDLVFDALNGNRILIDTEDARPLARSGTQSTGELREVIRGMKPFDCRGPVAAVDEVVPLRDEVSEWAALVAEGNATVHAASSLLSRLLFGEGLVDLAPVTQAYGHGSTTRQLAIALQESSRLTHETPP